MPVAAQVHPFRYSTGVCLPLLLLAWLPGAQAAEPQGTSDHRPRVADYGLPPDPEQAPAGPQGLRVLTWNIQYGCDEGADPNGWPQRKAALAAELKAAHAQILCLQEALAGQLDFLKRQLPDLDLFAQGRDDGESAGEHCAIFYDRALFERADAGTFWLSDHPERPGLAWGERYLRICSWVALIHRATGRRFRVMNTHLPLNAAARLKATRLIVERIETLHQLPTLLMGDFNEAAGPASLPELARCGMSDTLPAARVGQDAATFRWKGFRVARLDWILASPEWRITGQRTLDRAVEKIYPSDHCGVLVTLNLPEAAKGEPPKKK